MPKCKNNPKKTYKGTEPSPKGKGWCAGGMEEGVTKKGTDGNKWIVSADKNGNKRWKKDTKTKSKTKSTPKSTTKSKTTSSDKSVSPVDSRPIWKKALGYLFNGKTTYIDPSKYVYLTVKPFYYTAEALKAQIAEDEDMTEFKFKKNDISDAAIEKIYKKILTEWFFLFQENEDYVTLVKTEKKQNKIKFTLKYDREKVDIKDQEEKLVEGIWDMTSAGEELFIKKINKQKIYVLLYPQDTTLTQ